MKHPMLVLAAVMITACKPGDSGVPASLSCDGVAEHLISICDPFTGEDFRALCEITEIPLVTESTRQCIARTRECTEASLEFCELRSVTIGCADDRDCPDPFKCDVELEHCARCLSGEDCAAGRGCLMGTCYDLDSEFYRALSEVFSRDAGPASD